MTTLYFCDNDGAIKALRGVDRKFGHLDFLLFGINKISEGRICAYTSTYGVSLNFNFVMNFT